MPPSAWLNRPSRRLSAPVNAPFSCPNNSDSSRDSLRAAQLTVTNALPLRHCLLNGAGDPLLAGPRLPGNQDGRLRGATVFTISMSSHIRGLRPRRPEGLSRIYSRSSRFSAASRV